MNVKLALALAAFLGFVQAASAQGFDTKIDSYFKACAEQKSDRERSNCLGRQYASVDAELKTVWRSALTMIENNKTMPVSVRGQWKHNFREAQNFWVRYKEAECRGTVPYKYGAGSTASVKSLECFLRVTAIRLAQLKTFLK